MENFNDIFLNENHIKRSDNVIDMKDDEINLLLELFSAIPY